MTAESRQHLEDEKRKKLSLLTEHPNNAACGVTQK